MSYARFGAEGSNVYVFLSVGPEGSPPWLECCACLLNPKPDGYLWSTPHRETTTAGMLGHLDAHEAAGHTVPASCRQALARDQETNDEFMSGAGPDAALLPGWKG